MREIPTWCEFKATMNMASIDSRKPANDLSKTIQDCSFLVEAVFLSAFSYLGRLGFYLDDWRALGAGLSI